MFIKSDSRLINLEEANGVERTFNTVYIDGKGTGITFRTEKQVLRSVQKVLLKPLY